MITAGYVLLVLFLVLANGFFVAAEFALVGVRRSRVETLAAGGDVRAQRLLTLLDNLNAYISALRPLQAFYKLFRWPIRLLDWSGTRIVRLFGLHPSNEHASVYTESELRRLVDISRQSGHLEDEEQQLIHRVFDFSDTEVKEAMVPRPQVTALSVKASLDEVRNMFLTTGYSRVMRKFANRSRETVRPTFSTACSRCVTRTSILG